MACDQGRKMCRLSRSAGIGRKARDAKWPFPGRNIQRLRKATGSGHLIVPRNHSTSQHDDNRDSNARMKQVEQEVFTINVVDVVFVTVGPVRWPCVNNDE